MSLSAMTDLTAIKGVDQKIKYTIKREIGSEKHYYYVLEHVKNMKEMGGRLRELLLNLCFTISSYPKVLTRIRFTAPSSSSSNQLDPGTSFLSINDHTQAISLLQNTVQSHSTYTNIIQER